MFPRSLQNLLDAILGRLEYNEKLDKRFRALILVRAEHCDLFYNALLARLQEMTGSYRDNIPDLFEAAGRRHTITINCKPEPPEENLGFSVITAGRAKVVYIEED